MAEDESKRINDKEEAHAQAVLLTRSAELNADKGRAAAIEAAKGFSEKSLEDLNKMSQIDSSRPEHKTTAKYLRKVADVATAVKINPELLEEMKANPTHPRLLDIYDALGDIDQQLTPEKYKIKLEAAVMKAELEQTLKTDTERKAFKNLETSVRKKEAEIAKLNLPPEINIPSYILACNSLMSEKKLPRTIKVLGTMAQIAALDIQADRTKS